MGCRKITYYQAGEGIGETAFFSGGETGKKRGRAKKSHRLLSLWLNL
jgi:hypothetical protein